MANSALSVNSISSYIGLLIFSQLWEQKFSIIAAMIHRLIFRTKIWLFIWPLNSRMFDAEKVTLYWLLFLWFTYFQFWSLFTLDEEDDFWFEVRIIWLNQILLINSMLIILFLFYFSTFQTCTVVAAPQSWKRSVSWTTIWSIISMISMIEIRAHRIQYDYSIWIGYRISFSAMVLYHAGQSILLASLAKNL